MNDLNDVIKANKRMAFNYLARIRYNVRKASEAGSEVRWKRDQARMLADRIKAQAGFVYSDYVYQLEQYDHWAQDMINWSNDTMRRFGKLLKGAAPLIDATLTFDEMCDILNVNVMERRLLEPTPDIISLIFVHGAENSAETRRQGFKNTPMFNAIYSVMIEFLMTPEGREVGRAAMRDVFGIDMGGPDSGDDDDWRDANPKTPNKPLVLH